MQPEIKLLKVLFDVKIPDDQIFGVRAAISNKISEIKSTRYFHQHLHDNALLYRYPLVQFKNFQNNTGLIALNEAAEELLPLLNKFSFEFTWNENKKKLNVLKIQMNKFFPDYSSEPLLYKINHWMALNSKNYEAFQNEKSMVKRTAHLEKILKNNIVTFSKALKLNINKNIHLSIHEIFSHRIMKYKNVSFSTFDLSFYVNLKLPNDIGLGKASSVGFGKIRKFSTSSSRINKPKK